MNRREFIGVAVAGVAAGLAPLAFPDKGSADPGELIREPEFVWDTEPILVTPPLDDGPWYVVIMHPSAAESIKRELAEWRT